LKFKRRKRELLKKELKMKVKESGKLLLKPMLKQQKKKVTRLHEFQNLKLLRLRKTQPI